MMLHIVAMVLWGFKVAVGLALVDLSFVAMLVRMLRSFRRLPVILDGRRLTMRAGVHSSITIDLDNIAAFRANWNAEAIKRRTTLNLALIAWPNVVFDLREPIKVRRRRIISTIAHRLDDSASFQAAIARLERPHADR